jgi:hypothetical protein
MRTRRTTLVALTSCAALCVALFASDVSRAGKRGRRGTPSSKAVVPAWVIRRITVPEALLPGDHLGRIVHPEQIDPTSTGEYLLHEEGRFCRHALTRVVPTDHLEDRIGGGEPQQTDQENHVVPVV